MERVDSLNFQDAPHHANAREILSKIVIAQNHIGVRVEYDQTGEDIERRLHQSRAHQMIPAQEYGMLSHPEYPPRFAPDGRQSGSDIL